MKNVNDWLFTNSWAIMVALVLGIFWGGYNWGEIGSIRTKQFDLILELAKLKSEVVDIRMAVSANSHQNEVDAEINRIVMDLDKRLDILINSNETTTNYIDASMEELKHKINEISK